MSNGMNNLQFPQLLFLLCGRVSFKLTYQTAVKSTAMTLSPLISSLNSARSVTSFGILYLLCWRYTEEYESEELDGERALFTN